MAETSVILFFVGESSLKTWIDIIQLCKYENSKLCNKQNRAVDSALHRNILSQLFCLLSLACVCVLFFFETFLQAFLQDLGQGQAAVAAFNELSAHLLHEYSGDDTRRITEVTDKHNAVWNSINKRWWTGSNGKICTFIVCVCVFRKWIIS